MKAEAVMVLRCRAFAGVMVAVVLSGCAPDRLPVPKPTAPSAPASSPQPATCTGNAGRRLLTALFAALSAGRPTPVGTYFTQPVRFVRWIDPLAYVTFLPGPGDDNVTLDALQAHLDALARAGASATIVGFTDDGYQAYGQNEAGGWFTFDLRVRWRAGAAVTDAVGSGAVDCDSGKLTLVDIG